MDEVIADEHLQEGLQPDEGQGLAQCGVDLLLVRLLRVGVRVGMLGGDMSPSAEGGTEPAAAAVG